MSEYDYFGDFGVFVGFLTHLIIPPLLLLLLLPLIPLILLRGEIFHGSEL